MQNIKEKPLEKNEKNSHSKDKKQNNVCTNFIIIKIKKVVMIITLIYICL